jgi:hypothetical protein
MRVASAASVLFAGLLASPAFADPAPAAPAPAVPVVSAPAARKVPLRVVRVLDSTHQALLYNKLKNTHVLVEQGTEIDGYTVADIDDDSVTLTPIEGGAQVVLAGPDPSWRRRDKPATATRAPEDPYAAAVPMDPYADATAASVANPAGVATVAPDPSDGIVVRSVEAPRTVLSRAPVTPVIAGEGGVRVTEAPGASLEPSRTPLAAMRETGVIVSEAPPTAPPAPPATVIARTEITAALANFGALAASVRGSFTPAGTRLDMIPPTSLLARAGLRDGDLITSINNHPLRSLDDAADLYARAGSMKAATIQVQRAGNPVTLRLTFP